MPAHIDIDPLNPDGLRVKLNLPQLRLIIDALTLLNPESVETRDMQERLIKTLTNGRPKKEVRPQALDSIIEAVSQKFHVKVKALRGSKRDSQTAFVRQVTFYLARRLTGLSFPKLGDAFNRDHSTVIHGANLIAARMKAESAFATTIQDLEESIGGMLYEESGQGTRQEAMGEDYQGTADSVCEENGRRALP